MKILKLDSVFTKGKYKDKTVETVITEDRKRLIELAKQGYFFDDEVVEKAGYKRTIRDRQVVQEIVNHPKVAQKTYKKDTEKIEKIIEEITTIANPINLDVCDDNIINEYENFQ